MKDGRIDGDEAKNIFKTLNDLEGSKISNSKSVCRSGDYEHFDFTRFGTLSSVYLKMVNRSIGINFAKLKLNLSLEMG